MTIPAPVVTFVPAVAWTDLGEGTIAVLTDVINITAIGSSQLPAPTDTFVSVFVNAAGLVTLVMPVAANLTAGQRYTIKDESGAANPNTITVNGNGSLIDGAATKSITTNYGSFTIEWNGSGFSVVS